MYIIPSSPTVDGSGPAKQLLLFQLGHLPQTHHLRVGEQVYPARSGERRVSYELGDVLCARVEHLDPVVESVRDVDVTVPVDAQPGRTVELPVGAAGASEREDEVAVGCELLHPVVAPVGYVYVALVVDGYSVRVVELPLPVPKLPQPCRNSPSFVNLWTRWDRESTT